MSVLFVGNGADTFDVYGDAEEKSNAGYDSNWNRQSIRVLPDATTTTSYADGTGWSAVQEIWLHLYKNAANGDFVYLMDGADAAFRLRWTGTGGTLGNLRMEYLSGAATWTQIGSDVTLPSEAVYIDLHVVTGASGTATLFINQVERTSGSAAMTYAPDIDNIKLVNTGAGAHYFSGVIVADESTLSWRLAQGYMSGTGASSSWIGDYTTVDESELNDADFINSGTADQVETFAHTTPALTGYIPQAVAVAARALRGASGPQNLQLVLRSAGTNYFSGNKALGLGMAAYQHIWSENPATTAAFTSSQIAALQPGVKSIT